MSATCSQPEAREAGGRLDQEPARRVGKEALARAARQQDEPPGDTDLTSPLPQTAPNTHLWMPVTQWCSRNTTMVPGLQWHHQLPNSSLMYFRRCLAIGTLHVTTRAFVTNPFVRVALCSSGTHRTPIWEMPTDPSCVSDSGTNPGKLPHRPEEAQEECLAEWTGAQNKQSGKKGHSDLILNKKDAF